MMELRGYQIGKEIYRNSKRVVYRGIREADGLPVILKTLGTEYPSPMDIAQLHHEYEITQQLKLRGVIEPLSLEISSDLPVLILPDSGGISLRTFLHQHRLGVEEFLKIAIQLAQTLGEIHQHHIIHKDIKPSNIIIQPQNLEVKLIDFAIASKLSQETAEVVHLNSLEGTLAYMSPEQTGRMNRAIDYRTDFYSLGVTFYEMLTGELPYQAEEAIELVHCHIARMPVPPNELVPTIPVTVSKLVMKLLEKTAENRYQSGFGLKTDLQTCLNQWQQQGEIDEFSLGEEDVSGKLEIPPKLYGREREISQLLAAFERVCEGRAELVLVAGYSGIGKSALVQETHKRLVQHPGYFIRGKFDQFKRNIPYDSLIQAFDALIRQLLTENEAQLQKWQEKLLWALGPNGQIIFDVIPALELIMGKQPPVPKLGPTESQNRFKRVFQQFINVFTQAEKPLVLFLDDLQWADSASLKLIEGLISDQERQNLLLIGACRENEVSPLHPTIQTLERIEKTGVSVTHLDLKPLKLAHLEEFMADTFPKSADSQALAEILFHQSGGNPFFVTQLLTTLYREAWIFYNWKSQGWQWNIQQIQAIGIRDCNVVELIVRSIQKLPEKTQELLSIAACIGNSFNLEILEILSENSALITSDQLGLALQAGLIVPRLESDPILMMQERVDNLNQIIWTEKAPIAYQFLHDRIQQAAYSLIPEECRKETHLKIGQLLLEATGEEDLEAVIFDRVNHLNIALDQITDRDWLNRIAQLNLIATKKAKVAIAYEAALSYVTIGLKILAPDSWETDYALTFSLYLEAIELEYLNANFEKAATLLELALKQSILPGDRIKLCELQMQVDSAQLKILPAIDQGLQLLKELGVELLPLQSEQSLVIPLPSLNELENLPTLTDPNKLSALRILTTLCAPIFFAKPQMFPQTILTIIQFCLQEGNSGLAAFAYAFYGLFLSGLGEIEAGYHSGQIALKLLDKFHAKELAAKVYNLFNAHNRPWKEHGKNSLPQFIEGVQAGLETGDIEWACYCAGNYCAFAVLTENSLEVVVEQQQNYINLAKKSKIETAIYYGSAWRQVGLNLLGEASNPTHLTGASFDETEMLPKLIASKSGTVLFMVYLCKTILLYHFSDYTEAVRFAALAKEQSGSALGYLHVAVLNFYESLSLLATYSNLSPSSGSSYLEQVDLNQSQLQNWASHASINFQHKYDLVAAERAKVLGEPMQAMDLYDCAIAGAKEAGYLQEEALANELAGQFYGHWGKTKIAEIYLTDAYDCYSRWGAKGKTNQLEQQYPDLNQRIKKTDFRQSSSNDYHKSTRTSPTGLLDFNTVIQASQALIGEVSLDNLLAKLMRFALENAGAQTGYLLLNQNGNFVIKTSGQVEPTEVSIRQAITLETSPVLPLSIINYVSRTQEDIVFNNASQEQQFINDPYILEIQPKSVLCTPIIGQGKLLGLLYLENNLIVAAFNPSRVELLKLLCSQAAIALENAQLYEEQQAYARQLEKQVQERTQQLQQSNTRYYNLAANIPGMIYQFMMHPDGRFSCPYISPGCRKIYGVKAEAAMEDISLLMDLTYPDDREEHIESIARSAATLEPWHFIGRIIVSGQIKWVQGDANPEKQADGSILWDGLVVDISDRKQAEEKLRKSEERWQLALKGNNDGIWDWNISTNEVFFSPRWKQILGYEDHELPNDFNEWLQRVHSDDYRRVSQLCQEHLQGKIAFYSTEYRLLCKDGTYKWILDRGQALWDEAGNPVRMAGSNTDISDRKQAEEALRQSEEQFRTLVSSIPGAVYRCLCDHDWTMQYISDCVEEITGYPSYAFINNQSQSFGNIIHPEDRERCEFIILQATTSNQPFIVEYRIIHADGSTRWMYEKGQAIRGETEEIMYLSGVIFDVTDRKLAEESLAESERKYRHLVETSQDIIFSTDQSGYFTFVNQAVKQIHGYEPEEVIGRPFTDFQSPEQAAKDIEVFQEVLKTGSLFQYETVHLSKTGNPINFLCNVILIRDLDGNLIGTTGTVSDITKRKQAEEALLQSEAKLQKITANIPGMVYQFHLQADGTMKFSFVSEGCKMIYNRESQAIVDDAHLIIDTIYPDDLQRFYDTVEESAKTLQPWNWEGRVINRSGKINWLQANSTPEKQENGEIIWYGIVFEITERKRVELALQEAMKAAEAASKAKSEFLSKMSHELRTPLNAILGFTQILNRDHTLQSQQQDYLGIISRAGEHLLSLINDVLEMSKIEAGRISLNETSFDLYRLLTSLEEMFRLKAESKGLQLILERTPNLPPFIKTDESKLRQVFINLLGNAIKFTEKGGITVRVKSEIKSFFTEEFEKQFFLYLSCEIEDTGPGIRGEELDTLFDPFVQTETGRNSQSGTGLGLPISRQFVELMGGKITVSSTLEKGTIFKFNIKFSPADALTPGTEVPRQRVIGLAANQPTYRILVVEDKWESRLLLRNLLSPLGFEVREAVNGEDGVTMWRNWQPHLIWMDMQMPVMDGYAATRQIKRMTNGPIPVIIGLTASAFEENRAMVLEAGCDDFASKPFREDVIFQKMAEHLGVRYVYEEIPGPDVSSHSLSVPGDCLTVTECLQGMSPEWKTQLYQASSELNEEAIADLITQIPDGYKALATTLTNLVTQLRFDKIIELIQTND
ncbi:PAS domain S-box protein [Oscillatoria acuminata]|uniref:Circadian input-output histidine kinase CikA n=1 Tax=Oscillatoria acuminata PCC 6304 TaxID=56110 RepID=K9TMW8_9CYAN|nr:PAS domain S-box protein [Oscillatoria acuminata]AFY83491.1 PAS domain S-box [Oscillatoria acuminata PCC 6304]